MRSTTPKLLGIGLIVLVLAWYGFTRPDAATEGAPFEGFEFEFYVYGPTRAVAE